MRSFTLLETLMVLVIIGILATLSIAGYWQLLDNARQKVCETNLETLLTATEIYALEHDALPASLGHLHPSQVRRAYAKVMRKRGLVNRLAYAFVKMNTPRIAYAQFLTNNNLSKYGAEAKVFICPSDQSSEGISYGINGHIATCSWDVIPSETPIVGACDNHVFWNGGDIEFRHIRALGTEQVGIVITKDKSVIIDDHQGIYNLNFYVQHSSQTHYQYP